MTTSAEQVKLTTYDLSKGAALISPYGVPFRNSLPRVRALGAQLHELPLHVRTLTNYVSRNTLTNDTGALDDCAPALTVLLRTFMLHEDRDLLTGSADAVLREQFPFLRKASGEGLLSTIATDLRAKVCSYAGSATLKEGIATAIAVYQLAPTYIMQKGLVGGKYEGVPTKHAMFLPEGSAVLVPAAPSLAHMPQVMYDYDYQCEEQFEGLSDSKIITVSNRTCLVIPDPIDFCLVLPGALL